MIQTILHSIGAVVVGLGLFIAGMFGYNQDLGSINIVEVPALFETSLQDDVSKTATSIELVSGTLDDGTTLNGTYGFIIHEGQSDQEFITGYASGTIITSLTRGITMSNPNATSSDLIFKHYRWDSVKITDYPFIGQIKRLANGEDDFPNVLSYDTSISTSTIGALDKNISNVGYVNSVSFAGAPDSSETIKGISELATEQEAREGTSSGGTGARLVLPASLANSTSSATTTIPVSKTNGKLSQGFLDLTENFSFSGDLISLGAFTASSTALFNATSTFENILDSNGLATFETTTFNIIPTAPTTTPTLAGQLTTKEYTDTKAKDFGSYASRSLETDYTEGVAGLVVFSYDNCGSAVQWTGKTPTTTARVFASANSNDVGFTFPVASNQSWRIDKSGTCSGGTLYLWWIPLLY